MNERSTIPTGISVFVEEVSPAYFSLNLRPLREFSLGFGTIKVYFWRSTKLLPEVSPVCNRTEAILGEIFPTSASLPEVSLEARPPRDFSLGLGTIKASFWCCSGLLPGVSPVFDRTETILGEIVSTSTSLPEVSLEARPPREFSLGFGTIKASFWRCNGLLPGVSPVFDRTETILGEIVSTSASLPEVSLEARPPLEFSLGFGTTKASFWRCSGLLPGVSPVFDRTKNILEEISSTSASLPKVSLEARPSREFSLGFGTIKIFFWRCTKLLPEVSLYSIVQKLFLGKYFSHPSAFQRSLWKRVPPVSSLSGSVPSRHLFGAVPNYYWRSFQYSIVQKLFLGKYFPHPSAFQKSLWKRFPPS